MTRAITLLTENFSDWETALINSAGRGYYGFDVRFAAPGGAALTSSGGLMVTPHLAIESISLDELDLLIVCGGTLWRTGQAPDLTPLLTQARARGIALAGICDGTRMLAQAGVLNGVRHTSNSAENLAVPGYAGGAHYQDVPYAVADQRVVTASGTAPVSFMAAILATLGIGGADLDAYIAQHAAEHARPA
ncbi:glutamine amidotransferase [Chromobacterium subtsugae]|uniref:Glutamine amidotransferase n=1 Tax=Chromobacterium subtsugae TaxID=251747 RepID=A0ABS7FEJ5_9NEIS|nr:MULTISPECIES: type 1 glutamine amidotransferase family protein [Chromobacterium]KUM04848.1 glutamine amidotransferase [Chromobacterium subtsugae]KZE87750.1 glutamine amidotransferase [Chromobacterium sp. F49]MBW7568242.1 glutamine amidotransferase [Chromobacterium subtsugae]MBW8288442.1 glutamine amidotransferase [Chromobacterium subtsugae]WSE89948.1 type 1 glutamine amidotransferase family protein [Chromobacterium subtsugae]